MRSSFSSKRSLRIYNNEIRSVSDIVKPRIEHVKGVVRSEPMEAKYERNRVLCVIARWDMNRILTCDPVVD